jgi:gamma-glutamyltranspeptidase/glutathione hydrolase
MSTFTTRLIDFGMDIQEALDALTVHSEHFPSSFYPREACPARTVAENCIPQDVITELGRRGHEVIVKDGWENGNCMGIRYDREREVILGGVSPRGKIGYALER